MRMPGIPVVTQADRLNGLQLGLLQYQKTGVGLQLLREYVLGPERFDFAFRTYIKRWKFKSPQPADFFRTMEDAAGMDLAWFWRGWFLEDALLDQSIEDVRTTSRGATITLMNSERMVMPVTLEVEYADGTKETQRLPVEIWFKSDKVVHKLRADKEVVAVRLDPDGMLPDNKRSNNSWKAEQ
jgi:aminopeptidase N